MHNATDIALSRLSAQQRAMDVTANNLANADTPGFKAQRVLFSDWLSRQGAGSDPDVRYVQDRATYAEDTPGTLRQTGNPLDVAIAGRGYFTVLTQQGVRLTRAGRFTLAGDGGVTDIAGNALLDSSGNRLHVPVNDGTVSIGSDGTVTTQSGEAGRIAVVDVPKGTALKQEGGRLLQSDAPTTPATAVKLVEGAVEDSNVQPVLEMTRMMTQLREFQYVAQFVQAENDRTQNAIDKITKRS